MIEVPDGVAERLVAAAATRGVTAEELAVRIVAEQLGASLVASGAPSALAAFVGSVEGPGTRFDIVTARRDLAGRRTAGGTRNL